MNRKIWFAAFVAFAAAVPAFGQQNSNSGYAVFSDVSGNLSKWGGSSWAGVSSQDVTVVGEVRLDSAGGIESFENLSGEGIAGNAPFQFKGRATGRLESESYSYDWGNWYYRYTTRAQVLEDVQVHHSDLGGRHGVGTINLVEYEYGYSSQSAWRYSYSWVDVTYVGHAGCPAQLGLWSNSHPKVTSDLPESRRQRPVNASIRFDFTNLSTIDVLNRNWTAIPGQASFEGQWQESPNGVVRIPRLTGSVALDGVSTSLALNPSRDITKYEYSYSDGMYSYSYEYAYVPFAVKTGSSGRGTGMVSWAKGSYTWNGFTYNWAYSSLWLSTTTDGGKFVRLWGYSNDVPTIDAGVR